MKLQTAQKSTSEIDARAVRNGIIASAIRINPLMNASGGSCPVSAQLAALYRSWSARLQCDKYCGP
jgi:hypothetical protein